MNETSQKDANGKWVLEERMNEIANIPFQSVNTSQTSNLSSNKYMAYNMFANIIFAHMIKDIFWSKKKNIITINKKDYQIILPSIGEDSKAHIDMILSPSNDPTSKYGIDWTFMNEKTAIEKKKNKQQENKNDNYIWKWVISFTQIGLNKHLDNYINLRIEYLIWKSNEKPQMNLDEVEKMKLQEALSEILTKTISDRYQQKIQISNDINK